MVSIRRNPESPPPAVLFWLIPESDIPHCDGQIFSVHENRTGLGSASVCKMYFDSFSVPKLSFSPRPCRGTSDYGKPLPGPRHTPRAARQIEIRSSAGT
jgi:hypothetical protein